MNEVFQKREVVFNERAQIERPPGTKLDGAQKLPLGRLERKMTEAAVGGERRIIKRCFSVKHEKAFRHRYHRFKAEFPERRDCGGEIRKPADRTEKGLPVDFRKTSVVAERQGRFRGSGDSFGCEAGNGREPYGAVAVEGRSEAGAAELHDGAEHGIEPD